MKLLRVGEPGEERPAVIDENGITRDLSSVVTDIDGSLLSDMGLLGRVDINSLPPLEESERIGPCVADVGKLVAVGLNYSDHAAETGMSIPGEPILFMKATSSICGPNDDVILPKGAEKADWEVELGVVIGKEAKYVERDDSMNHVAGYCIVNDVSERAFQIERFGQWVKGKSADTFGPLGPWLVTPDEIPDVSNLGMWLEVDGERVQNGSTSTMIFDVPTLVSYISCFMSLQPGDVIATGTPPGVGLGMDPQRFLSPGQTMRLGIDGLGEQCQHVRAWSL